MKAVRIPSMATAASATACGSSTTIPKDENPMSFMNRYGVMRALAIAALSASGALLTPAAVQAQDLAVDASSAELLAEPSDSPVAEALAASKVGGPISRSEVRSRAMYWINKHVPYSMSKYYRDPQGRRYRTDCSGFVAMALHLPESPNTVTLPKYVKRINWSSLKKGDVVGTLGAGTAGANGHVVIFDGWANKAHTVFHTLEQRGGVGATKHKRSINFKVGSHAAKPYRYKKIK